MPEFIAGYPLRKIARKHEALRQLLWRVDFALFWSLVTLFRLLPVDWASAIGARVGSVIGMLMTRKTDVMEENFRTAFPEKSPREISHLVKACWSNAGRVLGEYPHLDHIAKDRGGERLEISVSDSNLTFRDKSRPMILVGAHLGNWELAAAALGRLGIESSGLYTPQTNPLLDRKLRESRAALKSELIPRDNCARTLMERLAAGRAVGMLIDRAVSDGGKLIPFFGREKLTTLMPAKLALKFDCDLIPAQVERIDGAHFRVTFHPPVRAADPDGCKSDQAVDIIRQVNQLFEGWIRQRPEDWFCSKRIWPKARPDKPQNARRDGE